MLDNLKKAGAALIGNDQLANAEQITQLQSELQSVTDLLAQANEQLTEQASLLEAALAKVAEFEAATNEAKAQAEAAAREAAEMKIAQRKAALGNVIGSENPSFDAIFGAVAALEDAAFDAFVGAHVMRNEQEAKSDAFNEVGFTTTEAEAPEAPKGMQLKQLKKKTK